MVLLAFINGGLGLALAGGHGAGAYVAYAIVGSVILFSWLIWTSIDMRRHNQKA